MELFKRSKYIEDTVRVDDIDIAYRVHGSGRDSLVLITGYIATMDMWDSEFIEALSRRCRVFAFDNRGMGGTSGGEADWTIDRFADDTAGLIESLGLGSPDVLGWSLGGDVALSLAVNHPESVDRLVLYAADCGGPQKVPAPSLREVLQEYEEVDAHFKRVFAELFPPDWMNAHPDYYKSFGFPTQVSNPLHVIKQNNAYNDWPGVYEALPSIDMPVLVATGTEDVSTPPENADMLARLIPGSWLVRVRGAGHGLQYQYPQDLARIVLDFLDLFA